MPNGSVKVLVATMSGTAEMVAEEVVQTLSEHGVESRILMMDQCSAGSLRAGDYIICSSTYGTGEVPDNGKQFLHDLRALRPDLRGVRYGLVGLGDSVYTATFCFGSKQFDSVFQELGARRVGEWLQHDRRSGIYPEDAAVQWAEEWLSARAAEDAHAAEATTVRSA